MPMNFPDTPTNGSSFTSAGSTWMWNGTSWKAATAPNPSPLYLPLAGGTLTGNLVIQQALTIGNNPYPTTPQAGSLFANALTTSGGSAFFNNVYIDSGSNAHLIANAAATAINNNGGAFGFWNAPAAAAGTVPTWTQRLGIGVNGDLVISGSYLTFLNTAVGGVNGTGGPFIYSDTNSIVLHLGSGNLNFFFQNNAGTNIAQISSAGNLYLNQTRVCTANAPSTGYNTFYDNYGGTAIYLGNGANYYRNSQHIFQSTDANGAVTFFVSGVVSNGQNVNLSYRQLLPNVDNTFWCGYNGWTLSWFGVCAYNFVNASDIRNKRDIEDLPDCLPFVKRLQAKRYKMTNGPVEERDVVRWGFVAQHVEAAMEGQRFGGHRNDNGQHGVVYHELTAILWKAVQELEQEVAALKEART
jgi:endosialidase-like protein